MSTIVIARKENRACIAADTLTSFGELRQHSRYEKNGGKILVDGENYIGIVGSAAHELVLESLLDQVEHDFSSRRSIFESLRRMHTLLKDEYFLNPKEEGDDPYESSRIDALIANRRGIFAVFALREVFEYSKFWAVGSGGDFALGAMHAVYERDGFGAEEIARAGVAAGVEFNNASAPPIVAHTLEIDR